MDICKHTYSIFAVAMITTRQQCLGNGIFIPDPGDDTISTKKISCAVSFVFSACISVKSNNKENVVTTKIFNKKFSGNAKEASGTGAGHGGGKHHFRKLCRKKSRSWKSWFEGKDLTVSSSSNNDQYYALLPLDESERSSDLGKKFW